MDPVRVGSGWQRRQDFGQWSDDRAHRTPGGGLDRFPLWWILPGRIIKLRQQHEKRAIDVVEEFCHGVRDRVCGNHECTGSSVSFRARQGVRNDVTCGIKPSVTLLLGFEPYEDRSELREVRSKLSARRTLALADDVVDRGLRGGHIADRSDAKIAGPIAAVLFQ